MRVRFTKGAERDFIEAERADGSLMRTAVPKKGPFPHDAVHLIVEQQLRFDSAFWGRIAAGATPDDIADTAKAGGHASSARAMVPAAEIAQLLLAERLVECFEAELWGSCADDATFRSVLDAACARSRIATPELSDADLAQARHELRQAARAWRALPAGASMTLQYRLD